MLKSAYHTKSYTGHEALADVDLVHMNGRVYDPILGRFMSADPFVQFPYDSQSFNRYSYVLNNPLGATDPSGYFSVSFYGAEIRFEWGSVDESNIQQGDEDSEDIGSRDEISPTTRTDIEDPNDPFGDATAFKDAMGAAGRIVGEPISSGADLVDENAAAIIVGGPVGAVGKGTTKGLFSRFIEKYFGKKSVEVPSNAVKCFVPGTLVLMADGTTKKIEDIEAGEWVMGDDPEDGQVAQAYIVTNKIESHTGRIVKITIGGSDSDLSGSIESTGEHPFWTENRGWQYAENILFGDLLRDAKGGLNYVVGVETEFRESKTYNLTVDRVHTYFVVTDGLSILVHNIDPFDIKFTRRVDASESFQRGPYAGRTVQSVIEEAKKLGRLPDGLTLNAARSYTPQGDQVVEAINNRTLFVAQEAGLSNVNPGNDIDSAKASKQVRDQKAFALKSGKNICP